MDILLPNYWWKEEIAKVILNSMKREDTPAMDICSLYGIGHATVKGFIVHLAP